ncbi:MAG: STAS domain-containing protein [Crocosphaera sp.]|nr:STAS domain-containing protein [Crocosphaera sp.]
MDFNVEKLDNGIEKVNLAGRMDLKGTNQIEMPFNAQVTCSKVPVIIDMAEVEFLASIGIRLILSSARAIKKRGSKMVILNPQPMVEDIFKTSGIEKLIEIYHDYDEACQAVIPMVSE